MAENKKYHSSQAERISRYLAGEMSPSEMHALEKEALDNPFLADAIEGIQSQTATQFESHIEDLKQRLNARTAGKGVRVPVTGITRIAAAVAIMLLLSVG